MKTIIIFIFSILFFSCGQPVKKQKKVSDEFSVNDFYGSNARLSSLVDSVFGTLDEADRIARMIVVSAGTNGKPTKTVEDLIKNHIVGGVLLLGGEKNQLIKLRHHFDSLAKMHGQLPLLYSSDAEPSLINRKIKGTQVVPNTIDLISVSKCDSIAAIISGELLSMGIRQNYAPVVDLSPNNAAITNRSFGSDEKQMIKLASAFIGTSQGMGVAATAKHFPGHGLVSGDTHNRLVTIDGELMEIANYAPFIEQGVVSIMVGHIAVINNDRYNTGGLPASCSKVIVTDLLKNEMGFKGLVITDAMNMGAVKAIDHAGLKAVEAGCDMILMEPDAKNLHDEILNKYRSDSVFKKQVDESVKKIIKLNICLNLF